MAVATFDDSFATYLNKATNVLNVEEDWEAIVAFCDKVNKDLEGPQTAVRLLVHKIQSPQERESLLALKTLEACVKNCGKRFQQEIGKFKFLNELIKVVSPKYLGNHMADSVKQRCIELLYIWSQVLPHEPKIKEAYQMLRKQGIIKQDPVNVSQDLDVYLPSPPTPTRDSIFEDEEKSKVLARLLRSRNPDDLQAANRLIKNLVKQDAVRIEKVSKRTRQLETVNNNIKLLNDMLQSCLSGSFTTSDKEIMKELRDNLETERPNLFRLAGYTDEHDSSAFSDIVKTNEALVKVIALYDEVINKADVGNLLESDPTEKQPSSLSELESLNFNAPVGLAFGGTATGPSAASSAANLLDDPLLSIGFATGTTSNGFSAGDKNHFVASTDDFGDFSSATGLTSGGGASGMPSSSGVMASSTSQFILGAVAAPATSSAEIVSPLASLSITPATTSTTSTSLLDDLSFMSSPASTTAALVSSVQTQQTSATVMSSSDTHSFAEDLGILTTPSLSAGSTVLANTQLSGSTVAASDGGFGGLFDILPTNSTTVLPSSQLLLPSNVNSSTSKPAIDLLSSHADGSLRSALDSCTIFSDTLTPASKSAVTSSTVVSSSPALESLDALGKSLLEKSLMSVTTVAEWKPQQTQAPPKVSLNQMSKMSAAQPNAVLSPITTSFTTPVLVSEEVKPLTDITVVLETIQPGSLSPIVAYDKSGIKVVIHFGKDRPRPDVQVMVVSTMSTCPTAIKNFIFQAAVPKNMKVKLQRASATDLPAYNPILPPAAITQIMLLAYPSQEDKVRLRFKISYLLNNETITDVGDVQFSCV